MIELRRKTMLALTLVVIIAVLVSSSCSAVFKAALSGVVRDAGTESGIEAMEVYAYTDKGRRDADYDDHQAESTFSPSNSAAYVARTTSAADGAFTINKIVWESNFPEFGKTADYRELSLLFFHESYGLHKNAKPVWITSDSTNNSMVDERFERVKQTTAVAISVRDAADGSLLDQTFDVRMSIPQSAGDADPLVKEASITGTGTLAASYPVGFAPTVTVQVSLTGSSWVQCLQDGTIVGAGTYPTFTISGNNALVDVYVKQTRLSFPAISGEVDVNDNADSTVLVSPDDGLSVWLAYRNGDGKIVLYDEPNAERTTVAQGDGANGSLIRHGVFNGLGTGMTWDDATYLGTYTQKEVLVVVDTDKDGLLTAVNDDYYEFTIRSDRPTKLLGTLKISTLPEVTAADLP